MLLKKVREPTYAGLQELVSSHLQLETVAYILRNNTRNESKAKSKVTGMKRSLTRNLSRKITFTSTPIINALDISVVHVGLN